MPRSARGEYLAFLDRRVRPEPDFLDAAMATMEADVRVSAVAPKVLADDDRIVFVDAALSFAGRPRYPHAGLPSSPVRDLEADVLFSSPLALFVQTRAFRFVGGFDDEFCAGVEFVDLGWRLWLAGFTLRYQPAALVRCDASVAGGDPDAADSTSGSLGMIFKNYDDDSLRRAFAPTMLLAGHTGAVPVDRFTTASPGLVAARHATQSTRARDDYELRSLFHDTFAAEPADTDEVARLRATFGIDGIFGIRRRIAIVTPDTLRAKMAGPAIRAWQMAIALSREHDVALATTGRVRAHPSRLPGQSRRRPRAARARGVVRRARVPGPRDEEPSVAAALEQDPRRRHRTTRCTSSSSSRPASVGPTSRRQPCAADRAVLNEQLRARRLLPVRQREAARLLARPARRRSGGSTPRPTTPTPRLQLADRRRARSACATSRRAQHRAARCGASSPASAPTTRSSCGAAASTTGSTRSRCCGRSTSSATRMPDVRLFFLGLQHPNPDVPDDAHGGRDPQARATSSDSPARHVFFNEGWVAVRRRGRTTCSTPTSASARTSTTSRPTFSFRTRILDYLWASLPVVAHGRRLVRRR